MDKLGVAVIGCGAISKMHLQAIAESDRVNLLYVIDIDEKKVREAAALYGCSFHTDYHEAIKDPDVDVVHICTPHYLHAPMAIEAMRNGKNVLTEKPMAISVEDANLMISVSKETGKKLGVCFQNRYNTTSVKIKEILQSGKAGRIIGAKASVTWHRDEPYYTESGWRGTWEKEGGGVLINQSIHTLDLLQWLIGDIDSIKGSYFTSLLEKVIEVEDTADAIIKFKNGAAASFYATTCYAVNSPVHVELICSNAVIDLEDDLTVKYSSGEVEHYSDINPATGEKSYWGNSHKRLIEDFYESIITGKKFALEGEQGINALKMVKAIHLSSESREWVKF